jgi:hypothetical protein
MSIKFTEYKGLNLPTVASEVLDFWKKENIFEKSVTTREGQRRHWKNNFRRRIQRSLQKNRDALH